MIDNLKAYSEWKIQLAMKINFISLENKEVRQIHAKSDNIEIMSGTETDDTIK